MILQGKILFYLSFCLTNYIRICRAFPTPTTHFSISPEFHMSWIYPFPSRHPQKCPNPWLPFTESGSFLFDSALINHYCRCVYFWLWQDYHLCVYVGVEKEKLRRKMGMRFEWRMWGRMSNNFFVLFFFGVLYLICFRGLIEKYI